MRSSSLMLAFSCAVIAGAFASPAFAEPAPTLSKYAECAAGFQASESDQGAAHGAFLAGKAAYDEADYPKAIDYFKDAYRRECTKHALLNFIARAYEARGDKAEAVFALETYLQRTPRAEDADAIKKRIDNLNSALAAEGTAKAQASVSVKHAAPNAGSGHSIAPWITVGVGGATLVAGGVLLAVGLSAVSSARQGCTLTNGVYKCADGNPAQHQADSNSGTTLATVGGTIAGVGAAAVIGGLVWHFLEPSGAKKTAIVPMISPSFTGIGAAGNF